MFVGGLANAVWIVPLLLLTGFAALVFGVFAMNRWHRHAGWMLFAVVVVLAGVGVEYSRNGLPNPSAKGTIDLRIGEPVADTMQRSTYRFAPRAFDNGIFVTGDVVDLRLRISRKVLDRPAVGGMDSAILSIDLDPADRTVSALRFVDQHRPLTLDKAISRARALERWFVGAGLRPPRDGAARFAVTEPASRRGTGQSDWTSAQRALADEPTIVAMDLFTLASDGVTVRASLRNWARTGASVYNRNFGREWELAVWIGRDI